MTDVRTANIALRACWEQDPASEEGIRFSQLMTRVLDPGTTSVEVNHLLRTVDPILFSSTAARYYKCFPGLFRTDLPYLMTTDGPFPREDCIEVDGLFLVKRYGLLSYPCCSACGKMTAYLNPVILGKSPKETGVFCRICRKTVHIVNVAWLNFDHGDIEYCDALEPLTKVLVGAGSHLRVLSSHASHFVKCEVCANFNLKKVCDLCEEKKPTPGKLHGYHGSNPVLLGWFPSKVEGSRYYGLEVEVWAQSRTGLVDASARLPWLTIQRDGSLDDICGAEIISAPHTLSALRERFISQGKAWREVMKAGSCVAHNRKECGIHIHVSRESLSDDTINRLRNFLCKSTNSAFLDVVAQRVSNQYCVRTVSSDRRYEALNTVRSDTVEFRLFRSNTRCDRILKNIEFVEALIQYAESQPPYMTWRRFVRWLSLRVESFPFLCAFLMEHHVSADATFLSLSRRMSLSEETDSSLLTEDFYVEDFERSVSGVYQPARVQARDSAGYLSESHPL